MSLFIMRVFRLLGLIVICLVFQSVAQADNCMPSYAITELQPPPGFVSTSATAISAKNTIAGFAYTRSASGPRETIGVIWNSRGEIVDTFFKSDEVSLYPYAINSYLTTGGSLYYPDGKSKAWIRRFGEPIVILASNQWKNMAISSIADSGQASGKYWEEGNTGSGAFSVDASGEISFLRKLSEDSRWDSAEAINSKGEIVGSSSRSLPDGRQLHKAVIWAAANSVEEIKYPTHINGPTWDHSQALAISSSNGVTGLFLSNDRYLGLFLVYHPFVWTREQGFKEIRFGPPGLEDRTFVGWGINRRKTVVGHAYGDDEGSAFIWKPCLGTQHLDSVVDLGERWSHLIVASAIGDSELIVGDGMVEESDQFGERIKRGFVLQLQ